MLINSINNSYLGNCYKQFSKIQTQKENISFAGVPNNIGKFFPKPSKELYKLNLPETFNRIKMFKNLSPNEKRQCFEDIGRFYTDCACFFTTITGYKPACLLNDKEPLKYLDKILYGKQIDVIHAEKSYTGYYNTYLLNREKVLETIERNKELYASRLKLSQNNPTSTIYSSLINRLKMNDKSISDLEGITLGFPKYSSIIFHLENFSNAKNYRNNEILHRKKLLESLHSENSPYKNLSKEEIQKLEEKIKEACTKTSKNPYYQYIKFVEEPSEIYRINKMSEMFNEKFSIDNFV